MTINVLSSLCAITVFVICGSSRQSTESFDVVPDPPFHGTIFVAPDLLAPDDPTAFESLQARGSDVRDVFDRRTKKWSPTKMFLFDVKFADGLKAEFRVNVEFGSAGIAEKEARFYAKAVGQLPTSLRRDVTEVTIHKGKELFGGGNGGLLIHTGQTEEYLKDGILEETLIHEACHTSLDSKHGKAAQWLAAQKKDGTFISTYALENPDREDIAESFLLYLAVKYWSDRITPELANTINTTIPNRIQYFASQEWDLYPQ